MFVHRKFTRHPIHLPVSIMISGHWTEFQTIDISRPGMFVRAMNTTLQVGQALQVQVRLPDTSLLEAMVRVRRVVPPTEFNPLSAGVGLEWFALSARDRNRWDSLVFSMRRKAESQTYSENSQDLRNQLPPADVREVLRKMREAGQLLPTARAPEHPESLAPVVMPVQPADADKLRVLATRCARSGHLFLKPPRQVEVGRYMHVILVHPDSDEEFAVTAVVERQVRGDDDLFAGVQVRCVPMSAQELEDLAHFVEGVPHMTEVVE